MSLLMGRMERCLSQQSTVQEVGRMDQRLPFSLIQYEEGLVHIKYVWIRDFPEAEMHGMY
jgi:hypothetical protein